MKRFIPILILLIVVVVVIVAITGVPSNRGSQSSAPLVSSNDLPFSTPSTTGQLTRNEFSTLLSTINRISIDTSVLNNPAFRALRDYPINLGVDIIGRTNPFAPVGSDGPISVSDVIIETLQPGKVTATSAELGAQLTLSDTVPTVLLFEYGTTDMFGAVTTPITVTRSGTTLITLNNLTPETTYLVRAVARRGAELFSGKTMTFTTAPTRTRR